MTFDPAALFRAIGLLPRALFDPHRAPKEASRNLIMLDGVAASFALSHVERSRLDDAPYYDWSWSSNVTYHVEIEDHGHGDGLVFLRRWDNPQALRRVPLRNLSRFASDFISSLEQAGPYRGSSVINHAVKLLRQVREVVARARRPETCITVFHTLLRGAAEAYSAEENQRREWLNAKTIGGALRIFPLNIKAHVIPEDLELYAVHHGFLKPDPASGRSLHPALLIRHAAGQLYEEAHRELEREEVQRSFSFATPGGDAPTYQTNKSIHFTPTGLARLMAELALKSYLATSKERGELPGPIDILDPACGSGAFLVEAYLCLQDISTEEQRIALHGIDNSPRAVQMASLALNDVISPTTPEPKLDLGDALKLQWRAADIVLMNPPFIAWNDLNEDQRETVKGICAEHYEGRPDVATAFILRAIDCLRPGGILAALLPSSLLSASSTESLRKFIFDKADVEIVSRFRGNDIFPNALVEAAMLVVRKRVGGVPSKTLTTMLLSAPGGSDAALRALRTGRRLSEAGSRYEMYEISSRELAPGTSSEGTFVRDSWLPRPQVLREVIAALSASPLPRVIDLFDVQQGIRAGANEVFVISASALRKLPKRERAYFRPLAGNKTIDDGRIASEEFIFYPYQEDSGLILTTEKDLMDAVPTYYSSKLQPAKTVLKRRAGIKDQWWVLTRPRRWQHARHPKLVSSYFGRVGKFAFDITGDYVVGQGFGWLFKDVVKRAAVLQVEETELPTIDEVSNESCPAYVALFNSRRFSQLLSYYSYRVMGGQFDLSPRFVNAIPIADLITPRAAPTDVVSELRMIGKKMGRGEWPRSLDAVDDLTARAYGIAASRWPIDID